MSDSPASPIVIGQPAPAFDLPSGDGSRVSLASLRGQWAVLYLYSKDNTSGCTTEAVEFTELLPQFEALGATVLGLSKDSVASHAKFATKHNLGVRLLADESLETIKAYDAWKEKTMCGKKCMGTVRSTVLIDPEGRVAAYWPKVAKSAGHAQKVLEELQKIKG
ncbi:peroxiredoxin [Megalodesulfovibrio paquesii]